MSEKPTGKHPGGRPTDYNEKFHPKLVKALSALGRTDEQMCEEMGISVQTFYTWKDKHPEFLEAIKSGKAGPDDLVEKSLFERATGYSAKVQKPMVVSQGAGQGSVVEIVEYTEHTAPDPTSMIFWLKNRRPEKWRDKQEVEHSGSVDLTTLTPEEFAAMKAKFLAENKGK